MTKVQPFLALQFSSEENLIEILPKIEKYIGKYNFFSQSISLEDSYLSSYKFIRVFSFTKKVELNKLNSFFQNVRKLSRLEAESNFTYLCGYLNSHQVITMHSQHTAHRICFSDDLFVSLEFVFEKQKISELPHMHFVFKEFQVKQFFLDLRRVLLKEEKSR